MKHDLAYNELLKAPVNVTWEITDRCNLQCLHCLSADMMERNDEELSFGECCRVIDELDRMEVFQINFGGGEPFLREDFLDILQYAHAKRITTCVSTNGTVLDRALVKKLKQMDLLYLQVSLDGATLETNDNIRGKGSYFLAIFGIELLARYEIPNFSINTVVTSTNFREIGDLYRLAQQYGAKTRLSRYRPSGNGKKMWDVYRLDRDQLRELSSFLSSHRDILTGDSFFSITSEARRDLGLHMCGAAKMTCALTPNGDVYPCAFLQDDFFRAGNVTRQPFDFIWRDAQPFTMLRQIRIESCESCKRFNLCHGGCPAVAYFLTRSLDQPDPECMTSFEPYISLPKPDHGVRKDARTV
jgi:mycofactocin biosynthetic radical S-adenosylmethionine protein MftC